MTQSCFPPTFTGEEMSRLYEAKIKWRAEIELHKDDMGPPPQTQGFEHGYIQTQINLFQPQTGSHPPDSKRQEQMRM
jgi:hypothetical protein